MDSLMEDGSNPFPSALTDDFLSQLRAGRHPNVNEFANRIPEQFDEVAEYLETLLFAEKIARPFVNTARSDDAMPSQIGGYAINRVLGRGGMGTVYEANHPQLSRKVAIKVLNSNRVSSRNIRERFVREAETAARLDHSNIVTLHDFGSDNGRNYLAMQFVDGITVADLFSDERSQTLIGVGFQKIAALGADIASALSHAHQRGAIHRDIKPSNLILDQAGKVWVMDFGLAKLRDDESDLSRTGDMIGTPRYMAPEQMRGLADERSDIYSLGLTLYELATGERAWDKVNAADMITVKASLDFPDVATLNPRVPNSLARIILKCCALRPEDRYQSAEELETVLRRFVGMPRNAERRRRCRNGRWAWLKRKTILLPALTAVASFASIGIYPLMAPEYSAVETAEVQPARNLPKVFGMESASNTFAVPELQTNVMIHDAQGTWTLAGPDAEVFTFDTESGLLAFREPADFESPIDVADNGSYAIQFESVDNPDDVRSVTICVLDVNEPPYFQDPDQAPLKIHPDSLRCGMVTPVDPDGNFISHGLVEGGDADLFMMNFQGEFSYRNQPADIQSRTEPYSISVEIEDSRTWNGFFAIRNSRQKLMLVYAESATRMGLGKSWNAPDANRTASELSDELSASFLDFASSDGCVIFHLHTGTQGIELWQSEVDKNMVLRNTQRLSSDSKLPPSTSALATADGETFYVVTSEKAPDTLLSMFSSHVSYSNHLHVVKLQKDGTFSAVREPVLLTIDPQVTAATVCGDDCITITTPHGEGILAWMVNVREPIAGHCIYSQSMSIRNLLICGGSFWPAAPSVVSHRVTTSKKIQPSVNAAVAPYTSTYGGKTSVTFANQSDESLKLVWVNQHDETIFQSNIAAGEERTLTSCVGYVWEIYGPGDQLWDATQGYELPTRLEISGQRDVERVSFEEKQPDAAADEADEVQ